MAIAKHLRLPLPVKEKPQLRVRNNMVEVLSFSGGAKIAVVIPKKSVKKAVDRNLIKRQCVEYFKKRFLEGSNEAILVRVFAHPGCWKTLNANLDMCIEKMRSKHG